MNTNLEACERYLQNRLRMKSGGNQGQGSAAFITISRQTGAGGITIGRLLECYLNEHDNNVHIPWTVFDKNLVGRVMEAHHLPKRFADYMREDKRKEMDELMEELFGLHPPDLVLVRDTSETIVNLAAMGRVILVGRGSNILTRRFPCGFHVRLIGSYEKRIKHIEAYYGFDRKIAEEFVKKEEQGKKKYLSGYFNVDIDNPLLYDMVLNTDAVSYGQAAKIIGRAVLDAEIAKKAGLIERPNTPEGIH